MPALLGGLRILVVDDNMHVQAIWKAILTAVDALCSSAKDTNSARAALLVHDIDIVIVDEHLDDRCGDGAMLINWIRTQSDLTLSKIPILACTSDSSEQNMRRLKHAGASIISLKPIVTRDVLLALGQLRMTTSVRDSTAHDHQTD